MRKKTYIWPKRRRRLLGLVFLVFLVVPPSPRRPVVVVRRCRRLPSPPLARCRLPSLLVATSPPLSHSRPPSSPCAPFRFPFCSSSSPYPWSAVVGFRVVCRPVVVNSLNWYLKNFVSKKKSRKIEIYTCGPKRRHRCLLGRFSVWFASSSSSPRRSPSSCRCRSSPPSPLVLVRCSPHRSAPVSTLDPPYEQWLVAAVLGAPLSSLVLVVVVVFVSSSNLYLKSLSETKKRNEKEKNLSMAQGISSRSLGPSFCFVFLALPVVVAVAPPFLL